MRQSLIKVSLVFVLLCGRHSVASAQVGGLVFVNHKEVEELVSADAAVRSERLGHLIAEHRTIVQEILNVLNTAVTEHKADVSYGSPLHCAILAAANWRMYEAWPVLMPILDYEIDARTLPRGYQESDRFPAASALLGLDIDNEFFVSEMGSTTDERRLRLLAWIVSRRLKSPQYAKAYLTRVNVVPAAPGTNPNVDRAIKLLDLGDDLLPPPTVSGDKPKD